MPPSDKGHDRSGRNHHRRDRKEKQREQTAHEEVSEGTTYEAYSYPFDDAEPYYPSSGQGYSGYSQEHTPYPPALGPGSRNYGGYSSKFQSTSPAFASTGQSYAQGPHDYQPHPQEVSQSSEDVHTIPSAIARDGRSDSTAEGIPESFITTFHARNMTMAEKTSVAMRKIGEEEADAVWANKNGACEKRRKDKKRCNPHKCPDNKSWGRRSGKEALSPGEEQSFRKALYSAYPDSTDRRKRRQKIRQFYESEWSERIKMTDKIWRLVLQRKEEALLAEEKRAADERKKLHKSCRVGYGDELEAIGKFDYDFGQVLENNEIAPEPSGAEHFATSIHFQPRNDDCSNSSPYVQNSSTSSDVSGQAVISSPVSNMENYPDQSSSKGIDHVSSQPNQHQVAPPAEPGQDREPDQNLLFRIDATKAEDNQWRESGQTCLDSQEVPRTALGGMGREDIHRYCEAGYSTQFDYVPENSSLALFEPTFTSGFDQSNASNRSGGRPDGGDGGDEGSDDQNRGGGAPNDDEDYGDWGRNYYDGYGEGPSGSWQPNIGGGYPKGPGGEFYALASEFEERLAKMSLK